jgi:hypothetical protein
MDEMFNRFKKLLTRGERHSGKSAGPSRKISASILSNTEELTKWFAENGSCPDCGCENWVEGPRGGLSQNVACANSGCGAEFNVARYNGVVFHVDRLRWVSPADRKAH